MTDFQNSFFLIELMQIAIKFNIEYPIAQPLHPLPLTLLYGKIYFDLGFMKSRSPPKTRFLTKNVARLKSDLTEV